MRSSGTARLLVIELRAPEHEGDAVAQVTAAAERLHASGVLEVHRVSDSDALAAALRARGLSANAEPGVVRVSPSPLPPVEELTGLEPPGPAERILGALSRLEPGGVFLAVTPRYPRMLPPHLAQRGAQWEIAERPDGTALVWVSKPR